MKKILVVDDNDDMRYTIKEALEGAGCNYEYIEAESGEVALSLLKKSMVDLILLDIMMPGIDGWEVAATLKSDSKLKDIPIIFLTAKTDSVSKGMGGLTAEDYIEKPFDASHLKKRIEKIIGK